MLRKEPTNGRLEPNLVIKPTRIPATAMATKTSAFCEMKVAIPLRNPVMADTIEVTTEVKADAILE
jgi:hypothetical protein